MKYVSIDIETTGFDCEQNQILSIGAVIEDTKLKLSWDEIPKFNAIILHRQINGLPRSISINKEIIELLGEYIEGNDETRERLDKYSGYNFYKPEDVAQKFFDFLWVNGFDYEFSGGKARIDGDKIYPPFNI